MTLQLEMLIRESRAAQYCGGWRKTPGSQAEFSECVGGGELSGLAETGLAGRGAQIMRGQRVALEACLEPPSRVSEAQKQPLRAAALATSPRCWGSSPCCSSG